MDDLAEFSRIQPAEPKSSLRKRFLRIARDVLLALIDAVGLIGVAWFFSAVLRAWWRSL